MKCVSAIVLLAMAVVVAESHVIPAWPWGLPIAAIPGSTVIQSNPAPAVVLAHPAAIHVPAAVHVAHPAAAVIAAHPAVVAGPAVIAAPAPEAQSVSATRGSVHVAPLPGHAINQQQLNLAPAPGTA
uniref:Putative cuticle protein n=1 Tax=Corethrella appendiculata TaxID=1370023 RepID=U5EU93_9DIPT